MVRLNKDSLFSDLSYEKGYALLDYIETLFKNFTSNIVKGEEFLRKMIRLWIKDNYLKQVFIKNSFNILIISLKNFLRNISKPHNK